MVALFMEAGFTYFDTAFVYGTSERISKSAKAQFYKSLERACPQHLKITDFLKQCSEILEQNA